ncbi:MAG: hypothetical protein RBS34_13875 [Desulfofustis sp.]|jgi:hypothetical protein|nr:hypothetical protein [Desulfofustis sp.]
MAVPSAYTYSAAALVAAHTAFRDLLDTGAGNATIKIRDASDVLLATITLADPCGSVNGTTGQLTFTVYAREDSAPAGGTAAYGEFCDVAGAVHLSLPAQEGSVAVSGYLVMNTLTVVAAAPVEVSSAVIG